MLDAKNITKCQQHHDAHFLLALTLLLLVRCTPAVGRMAISFLLLVDIL